MITRLDMGDVGTDGLDDSRRLVTHHHRRRVRLFALDVVQVAVTYARGRRPYQDLVAPRRIDGDVVDLQRRRDAVEDGRLHGRDCTYLRRAIPPAAAAGAVTRSGCRTDARISTPSTSRGPGREK